MECKVAISDAAGIVRRGGDELVEQASKCPKVFCVEARYNSGKIVNVAVHTDTKSDTKSAATALAASVKSGWGDDLDSWSWTRSVIYSIGVGLSEAMRQLGVD